MVNPDGTPQDVSYKWTEQVGATTSLAINLPADAILGAIRVSARAGNYLRKRFGVDVFDRAQRILIEKEGEEPMPELEVELQPEVVTEIFGRLDSIVRASLGKDSLAAKIHLEYIRALGSAASANLQVGWLQDLKHRTGLRLLDLFADEPIDLSGDA